MIKEISAIDLIPNLEAMYCDFLKSDQRLLVVLMKAGMGNRYNLNSAVDKLKLKVESIANVSGDDKSVFQFYYENIIKNSDKLIHFNMGSIPLMSSKRKCRELLIQIEKGIISHQEKGFILPNKVHLLNKFILTDDPYTKFHPDSLKKTSGYIVRNVTVSDLVYLIEFFKVNLSKEANCSVKTVMKVKEVYQLAESYSKIGANAEFLDFTFSLAGVVKAAKNLEEGGLLQRRFFPQGIKPLVDYLIKK